MLWFWKCFVHDARYLYKEQFEKLNGYFKMYLTIDGLRDIILYNIRKGSSLLQAIHKKKCYVLTPHGIYSGTFYFHTFQSDMLATL